MVLLLVLATEAVHRQLIWATAGSNGTSLPRRNPRICAHLTEDDLLPLTFIVITSSI